MYKAVIKRWGDNLGWGITYEIECIDKANRRKRKALKQMTKAIEKRNARIELLEEQVALFQQYIDMQF